MTGAALPVYAAPKGLVGVRAWLQAQFELSRGGHDDNMRPMEGLRGYAVFLVFLVHFVTLLEQQLQPGESARALMSMARPLVSVGHSGVDLFFVLSGYLIYGSLLARVQAFGPYAWRRVQRIYPAFLAVFALYVVLTWAMPSSGKLPSGAADAGLYLVANLLLLPGLFPIEPLISVAWSLSYEMFFYLVVPLLIAGLGLRTRSPGWRVGLIVVLSAALLGWCALNGGHVRLVMFLGGMLLWEVLALHPRRPLLGPVGAAIALACCTAAPLLPALLDLGASFGYTLRTFCLCVAFCLLCQTCFSGPGRGWLQVFCWTPLRWLGNMSYSYYLLHGLALNAVFLVLSKAAPAGLSVAAVPALLFVSFGVTLLASAALFVLVERPFSLSRPASSRMR